MNNNSQLTIEQAQRQIEELQKHIEHLKSRPTYKDKVLAFLKDNSIPAEVYGRDIAMVPLNDSTTTEGHIMIPLPMANQEWSAEAFEYSNKIVRAAKKNIDYDVYVDVRNTFEMGNKFFVTTGLHALAVRFNINEDF